MVNLHAHIMSLVEGNNVKQNTSVANFRMSHENYTTTISTELYDQLTRYCEANPTTPRTLKDAQPRPMSYSKAIRRAVYELMSKPLAIHQTPNKLPAVVTPPDRVHAISWTMPRAKPQDAQYLAELCSHYGVKTSEFVRRAIYLYTKKYAKELGAASDAWC